MALTPQELVAEVMYRRCAVAAAITAGTLAVVIVAVVAIGMLLWC